MPCSDSGAGHRIPDGHPSDKHYRTPFKIGILVVKWLDFVSLTYG